MPWFDDICVGPLARPARFTEIGARLANRRAFRFFRGVCEQWSIDLIHCHAFHRSLFTAGHVSGIPIVATSHGDAANKRYRKQRIVRAYSQIAPRVDIVTALHCGIEAHIKRNFGDLLQVTIIPNGLDDVWLQPPGPGPRDLLLCAGRLGVDKRPELAVAAYAGSTCRHSYGLAIAGDGELKQELISLAKAKGLAVAEHMPQQNVANTVFFCGYQTGDALRQLYGRSRLLLHPSRTEAFCLVLLEAMAMGALPICANLDTYKAQFADSACKVIFVEGDASQGWTEAIDLWANSPQLAELGERNRVAVARFAWSAVFPLYLQCYNEAVASRSRH